MDTFFVMAEWRSLEKEIHYEIEFRSNKKRRNDALRSAEK